MKKPTSSTYLFAFAGIVIAGVVGMAAMKSTTPAQGLDDFAEYLTENGVKMYGTYWCGHCKNQKEMFGDAFEKINYIECALPDRQGQTKECEEAGITGYPTWEFGDGTRVSGEIPLEYLAEKVGYELPTEE